MGEKSSAEPLELYEAASPSPILFEEQTLLKASAPITHNFRASATDAATVSESSSAVVTFRHKRPDLGMLSVRTSDDANERGYKRPQPPNNLPNKPRLASSWSMPHFCEPTTPQDLHSVGISQILDFLFLGNSSDATSTQILTANNIQRVISVTDAVKRAPQIQNDSQHFFHIPIKDTIEALLFQYFQRTYEFIEETRRANERVLVHCMAGISRSPTIVIAYLMRSRRMGYRESLEFIRRKRPIVDPNMNFISQLRMYEIALSYHRIIPMCTEDPVVGSTSRASNTATETTATSVTKSDDMQRQLPTIKPRRPSYLNFSQMNKSQSSDYIASALRSNTSIYSTTTTFSAKTTCSSSLSSSSYSLSLHSTQSSSSLNDATISSRLSTASTPSIHSNNSRAKLLARTLNKNANHYFGSRHHSSASSLSRRTSTPELLNSSRSLMTPAVDDIPSPSAEFSKLGITAINPCFAFKRDVAAENRKCGGSRCCSTSTDVSESASSGVFTENSYEDRGDDRSSIGALEDEDRADVLAHEAEDTVDASMFENPIFHVGNRGNVMDSIAEHSENVTRNLETGTSESQLPLESRKSISFMMDHARSNKSILRCVTRKCLPNRDCENSAPDNHRSWNCYCCPEVKSEVSKRYHPIRSIIRFGQSSLPPLNDEDMASIPDQKDDVKKPSQCPDSASDDGFSEKWKEDLLSDEEASLKSEAVMQYIIKHFGFENMFMNDNNNTPSNAESNNKDETSPSKKKPRIKQASQSAEINSETKSKEMASDVKPPGSSLLVENASYAQAKQSCGGLYPTFNDEREYEMSNFFITSESTISDNSSHSLYPSFLQQNFSSSSSLEEQTTKTTIEGFYTESTSTTTAVTGTSPLSKRMRKSPTKSAKNDVGFDNAHLDPDRASISSASSLEIFVI